MHRVTGESAVGHNAGADADTADTGDLDTGKTGDQDNGETASGKTGYTKTRKLETTMSALGYFFCNVFCCWNIGVV